MWGTLLFLVAVATLTYLVLVLRARFLLSVLFILVPCLLSYLLWFTLLPGFELLKNAPSWLLGLVCILVCVLSSLLLISETCKTIQEVLWRYEEKKV